MDNACYHNIANNIAETRRDVKKEKGTGAQREICN